MSIPIIRPTSYRTKTGAVTWRLSCRSEGALCSLSFAIYLCSFHQYSSCLRDTLYFVSFAFSFEQNRKKKKKNKKKTKQNKSKQNKTQKPTHLSSRSSTLNFYHMPREGDIQMTIVYAEQAGITDKTVPHTRVLQEPGSLLIISGPGVLRIAGSLASFCLAPISSLSFSLSLSLF